MMLVSLLALCLVTEAAIITNPADKLPQHKRELLDKLWKQPLALSERLLHRGHKFEADARQWPNLLEKLTKPGSTVKVVVYGGSVSVGYARNSTTSYPERLVAWLQEVFPEHKFQLINLARRATAATFAALCLAQQQPVDADLIIVEYSVNGWGGQCQCSTSAQNAGWETLVRKAIRRSPKAALLAFASFLFEQNGQPAKYFETGEDQHAVIARRYGIPMMSVRDAMYDEMMDPSNRFGVRRSEVLVDIVHPGDYGCGVYAAFLAWAIRHQITRLLLHSHQLDHDKVNSVSLPPPIVADAAQEDWPTFCAEGEGMKGRLEGVQGFDFVDEGSDACPGCHKWGYASTEVGSTLTMVVNSDILSAADKNASSRPEIMLALSYLRSHRNTGKVRLECVAGCSCESFVLDTKPSQHTSEIHTHRFAVSAHKECKVKMTVLQETSTGGHKFRLSSFAVHKKDKVMQFAYAPVYDRRRRHLLDQAHLEGYHM